MVTVLIAGGGTGGHVFPMIAVGEALAEERPDVRVVYVGTGRGIETRVVPAAGGDLRLLDVLPLRGAGLKGFLRGAVRAAGTLPEARALVRDIAPDVVFSVGGYAAGPVTLAARSLRVPVTLLEPNCVVGLTNRLLKPLVTCAYVCFPETRAAFGESKAQMTGVPLRRRFESVSYADKTGGGALKLLVMGGSLGAKALNESVPRAIEQCMSAGRQLKVVHQTGRDKDAEVRQLYRDLNIADAVQVRPFIEDVATALAEADLVIERAGAGSLAELCAIGRPAILIPYPHAADDHQRHNAESLERDGAAVCVLQHDASVGRLAAELNRLFDDAALLGNMAARARRRGRPDAARTVARDLLRVAGAALGEQPAVSHPPTNDDTAGNLRARVNSVQAAWVSGQELSS